MLGIFDFATVTVAENKEERGLPESANKKVEWEVPCEFIIQLAHPLPRSVGKIFWTKGNLRDVTVQAHQHEREVYQRGKHLHFCARSDDDIAVYQVRLQAFEGPHDFFLEAGGTRRTKRGRSNGGQ